MHFGPSDEQDDLRRTVRKFLDDVAPLDSARAQLDEDHGLRPGVWARMTAELGLPGLLVPEEHGGTGAGPVELVVVMAELGRLLVTEPILGIVFATEVLTRSGDPGAGPWLRRIAAGTCVATVADTDGRWDTPFEHVRAHGNRLTGECAFVPDGCLAGLLVVAATAPDGPRMHLVEGSARGLVRTPQPVLDGTRRLARSTFDEADAVPLAGGAAVLARARDTVLLALAAEQLGGARECRRTAIAYATVRHAFGRPIGSFQAIKHTLATLHLEIEAAWAALLHAAWTAAQDGPDLPLLAATATASCSEVFLRAATENIQVHGGVGFTWEHPAHLYLRRARASYELYGPPAQHLERAAALLGL